jgi:predicted nucleotidyltransferase
MDDAEAKFHALHAWLDREEAHSRHVLGNAKLVSTFSSTLAATLFVAAVADAKNHCADVLAFVLLVLAVGFTLWLIAMKRNESKYSIDELVTDGTTVDAVPTGAIEAAKANKKQADDAHLLLLIQICLSLASSGVAIVPMLAK